MTNLTTATDSFAPATETAAHLFDNWFDPIESGVRERVRGFIEELIRCELDAALARPRYGRAKNAASGSRSFAAARSPRQPHMVAHRQLRQNRDHRAAAGCNARWQHQLPAQPGAAKSSSAPHAHRRYADRDAYLAGTNTRRVAAPSGRAVPRRRQHFLVSPGRRRIKAIRDAAQCPSADRRADGAADPRRHRGSRPARSQVHGDLAAGCRFRGAPRPEGSTRGQAHGAARRSAEARAHGSIYSIAAPAAAGVPDRRRCAGT